MTSLSRSGDAGDIASPDEALRFAKETGIDALAISFGSSHGNYPEGYVPVASLFFL